MRVKEAVDNCLPVFIQIFPRLMHLPSQPSTAEVCDPWMTHAGNGRAYEIREAQNSHRIFFDLMHLVALGNHY